MRKANCWKMDRSVISSRERQLLWQKGFVDKVRINLFILSRHKL